MISGSSNGNPWIAKTDSLGYASPIGVEEIDGLSNFQVNFLGANRYHIKFENANKLVINDITGRKADSINLLSDPIEYDASHLQTGVYLFSFYKNGVLMGTKKVVVQN